MIEFSVIVLTYNCSMEQTRRTLRSVLQQEHIEYEILVCDDGSGEKHFEEIRDLLNSHGLSEEQYRLLGSEENQGTVKNILKGLRAARGKYAKLIGAGDMLYQKETLRNIYDHMEENQAQACFGMMRGFREKADRLEFVPHTSPRDIRAYRRQDERKIAKNLLVCEDWVSGAGIFATTEYYKKYISLLEGRVLYCEDWATALSAVDHVFLTLYDQYVVWYEVGEGISTSANTGFRKKLFADNKEFWKVFEEYYRSQGCQEYGNYIRKRRRKKRLEHLSSNFLKNIYKAIVNPDMVFYEFDVRRQKKQGMYLPLIQNAGFLDGADWDREKNC